jgi:hypothetical protein
MYHGTRTNGSCTAGTRVPTLLTCFPVAPYRYCTLASLLPSLKMHKLGLQRCTRVLGVDKCALVPFCTTGCPSYRKLPRVRSTVPVVLASYTDNAHVSPRYT